ncbi:phosphoribosylformylglycinamidine cyclo-ligase [Jatrophihabitans sp. DSM 44399]|uniref:Phosphoribosylformylglycinamidine cyclo-ligase n=1 Tax=Jatrophihabitans lederbergiae TaxID=3075547 RepID=A0ABU2J7P5_9ACTN|nr:phosphoribosylformylglycinamidine cyclo-ligase [Jatrophihabitans sp. DSM 44399]MDT0261010.1 phosphoribosylformylglycinamidine cyclo-ligase [Jatrophihabitans sp. DSM 44399]
MSEPLSYASAGVDIEAGDRAVELMKTSVKRTSRSEVLGGLGGFAGLFQLDLSRYPQPVLATSTDGVGTKLVLAQQLDRHDTIGIDLVAMVIDDLVVVGAEPLFMTDYIATGKVVPEKIAQIVGGIAEGCVQAGCALVGGETAEHPGVMGRDAYDISGAGTGVVNADAMLGADRIEAGDVLLALGSSGVHSNGYSLVRHVLATAGLALSDTPDELSGRTLGDELLTPTRIYAQDCLALLAEDGVRGVHAFSHITGGGLAGNLTRVLPAGLDAVVDRSTWTPQPVFQLLARAGGVARDQLEPAFNLGVGMIAVLPATHADSALAELARRDVPSWRLGEVRAGSGQVQMTGDYAACAF